MIKKKSSKTIITISVISLVLLLILGGIGFYLYFSTSYLDVFKVTRNGITMQAVFYDSNGNPISGTSQTTVNNVPGFYFMSLQLKVTNTGTAPISGLRMTSSAPSEFASALQGATASQPSLIVGASKVLEWDTGNACPNGQSDCAGGGVEKCINAICLIDISNFIGTKTFNATIVGDFTNAYGVQFQTSTFISLPILFEQEKVVFRTTSLDSDYSTAGEQVAVDRNADGTLESYITTNSISTTYDPSNFIAYTVQNNLVFKHLTNSIVITQATNLDKTITYPSTPGTKYDLGGTLTTVTTPTQPFWSNTPNNCGNVVNVLCQERYSIAVALPPQVCGDGSITGTELCDGTDLGTPAHTCIDEGFTGGTLACSSCTAWDTSLCTGGTGTYVKFRTSLITYPTSGAIAWNPDLATRCDGITLLNQWGRTSASLWSVTDATCPTRSGYTLRIDQSANIPEGISWSSSPPCLYSKDSDTTQVTLAFKLSSTSGTPCTSPLTGQWCTITYDSDDLDKTAVENVVGVIDGSREVIC